MPTMIQRTRKNASFPTDITSSRPSKLFDTATVDRTTMRTTARMSSRIRMDMTRPANCFLASPRSSKAL